MMFLTKFLRPALLTIFAVSAFKLSALHPGADVPGEAYKLKWHNCSPFPLGKMNEAEDSFYWVPGQLQGFRDQDGWYLHED